MDIVITYVNGADPAWQRVFYAATGRAPSPSRFRDWGTLRALLRSIARYAPIVGQVHLVVASESQVPQWVDRKAVHIVFHRDIIPVRFLPTFNSCTIEMFLHKIPGLSEEFVYFNDDMLIMQPCTEEDFFREGRPCIWERVRRVQPGIPMGMFQRHVQQSCSLAALLAGVEIEPDQYICPQHSATPLLKSVCQEVYHRGVVQIHSSLSKLRTGGNLNQYLFADYLHFTGRTERRPQRFRYLSFASGIGTIRQNLTLPKAKILCINDSGCPEGEDETLRKQLYEALEGAFPEKSHYEL